MIARVFPRRTAATPDDALAFTGPPGLFPPEVDAVHVSVAFTWDMSRAERLAREWRAVAPVTISGPATGERGGDFMPGLYLKKGYVITSRGCPNRCWFCSVWRREGESLRELPITEGFNILDDNLLACSRGHIDAVFAMLATQHERARFTGGLEAARLEGWHVDRLGAIKPALVYFAYDEERDWEPLVAAADKLRRAEVIRPGRHVVRAYVLIGYPKDTMADAERRLRRCIELGIMPMAMLYRDAKGARDPEWRRFQRLWALPKVIGAEMVKAGAWLTRRHTGSDSARRNAPKPRRKQKARTG